MRDSIVQPFDSRYGVFGTAPNALSGAVGHDHLHELRVPARLARGDVLWGAGRSGI